MKDNSKTNPPKKKTAEIDPSNLKNQTNPNIDGVKNNKNPINVSNYRDVLSKKQLKKLKKKRASFLYKTASFFSIFMHFILMIVSIVLIVVIFEGPNLAIQAVEKYKFPDSGIPKKTSGIDPEIEVIIYETIRECEDATLGGCIDIIETTIVDDIFWPTVNTIFEGGVLITTPPPEFPEMEKEEFEGINPMLDDMINQTVMGTDQDGNEIIGMESLMIKVNELIEAINVDIVSWVSEEESITIGNNIDIPQTPNTDPEGDNSLEGGTIVAGVYTTLELINEIKEIKTNGTEDLTEEDLPKIPTIGKTFYEPLVALGTDGINIDKSNFLSPGDKGFSWIGFIDKIIDEIISILEHQLMDLLWQQIIGINDQAIAIDDEIQKLDNFNVKISLPNDPYDSNIDTINKVLGDIGRIIDDALESSSDLINDLNDLVGDAYDFLWDIEIPETTSIIEMIDEIKVDKEEYKTNPDVVKANDVYTLTTDLLLTSEIVSWILLIYSIMGIIVLSRNKKGKLGNRWTALPFTIIFIIPPIATIFGRMDDLDQIFEEELADMDETKKTTEINKNKNYR